MPRDRFGYQAASVIKAPGKKLLCASAGQPRIYDRVGEGSSARSFDESEQEAASERRAERVRPAHSRRHRSPEQHRRRQDDRRPTAILHDVVRRHLCSRQERKWEGTRPGGGSSVGFSARQGGENQRAHENVADVSAHRVMRQSERSQASPVRADRVSRESEARDAQDRQKRVHLPALQA